MLKQKLDKSIINSMRTGNKVKEKDQMKSKLKLKKLMLKIRKYGRNIMRKWINIGHRSIKLISWNGNIALKNVKEKKLNVKRDVLLVLKKINNVKSKSN